MFLVAIFAEDKENKMLKILDNDNILHVKHFDELSADELYALLKLRAEVFVVEQNCVYQDLDDDDQSALHLWITDSQGIIITMARVCAAGTHMNEVSIGRVIAVKRRMGYGQMIVNCAVEAAVNEFGADVIEIEAQEYTMQMYEKIGFRKTSDVFVLDGIPHVKMTYTRD